VADSGETGAKAGARTAGATAPTTDPDYKSPPRTTHRVGRRHRRRKSNPPPVAVKPIATTTWSGLRTRRAPVAANRNASDSPLVPRGCRRRRPTPATHPAVATWHARPNCPSTCCWNSVSRRRPELRRRRQRVTARPHAKLKLRSRTGTARDGPTGPQAADAGCSIRSAAIPSHDGAAAIGALFTPANTERPVSQPTPTAVCVGRGESVGEGVGSPGRVVVC